MAFFKYDGSEVEKFSKELESSLGSISNTEVSKLLTFAKNKLKEIQSSKSKEENYQSYHIVSMALIHVVNTYDIGGDYNAYSCPMVKKKWLQNSSKLAKVHNPYAAMMPHCGSQDTKF
ncbi:PF11827 family protein [Bacteriovorax sp. DB6_IX]|nr:PF11827 family protein [Bacteriovorax sp. DB6_IX]